MKKKLMMTFAAVMVMVCMFTVCASAAEVSYVHDKKVVWSYANFRNGPGSTDYKSYGYVDYGDSIHTYKKTTIADSSGYYWCLSKVTKTSGSLTGYYGYIVSSALG